MSVMVRMQCVISSCK